MHFRFSGFFFGGVGLTLNRRCASSFVRGGGHKKIDKGVGANFNKSRFKLHEFAISAAVLRSTPFDTPLAHLMLWTELKKNLFVSTLIKFAATSYVIEGGSIRIYSSSCGNSHLACYNYWRNTALITDWLLLLGILLPQHTKDAIHISSKNPKRSADILYLQFLTTRFMACSSLSLAQERENLYKEQWFGIHKRRKTV